MDGLAAEEKKTTLEADCTLSKRGVHRSLQSTESSTQPPRAIRPPQESSTWRVRSEDIHREAG